MEAGFPSQILSCLKTIYPISGVQTVWIVLCWVFFSLPLSDVQIEGSCEAGALRRGPKKECRDSMIHKAELFNGWMHVEHSAPAEPGSPQNRCRLVCKPLQQHTQHNSGRLPKISS